MGKTIITAKLTYPLEIRWHGRGGQGAVTAAKLLAETALGLGKQIQAFPQFGSERRGAPIIAFTRIDETPITLYTTIPEPNVVIVLDESLLGLPGVLTGLREDGLLLVDSPSTPRDVRERVGRQGGTIATVPASAIAVEHLGRPVTNTAMLGAFLAATGILDLHDVLVHVERKFAEQFPESVVAGNLRAMQEAYRRVALA
jgi:pyruvate ferredoxin oxidoreductase gamma subunit